MNTLKTLASIVMVLLFTGLLAVVMVEWAVGCGESYVDSQGQRHYHQCVFLDFPKE